MPKEEKSGWKLRLVPPAVDRLLGAIYEEPVKVYDKDWNEIGEALPSQITPVETEPEIVEATRGEDAEIGLTDAERVKFLDEEITRYQALISWLDSELAKWRYLADQGSKDNRWLAEGLRDAQREQAKRDAAIVLQYPDEAGWRIMQSVGL
jgi:hypothetical protein